MIRKKRLRLRRKRSKSQPRHRRRQRQEKKKKDGRRNRFNHPCPSSGRNQRLSDHSSQGLVHSRRATVKCSREFGLNRQDPARNRRTFASSTLARAPSRLGWEDQGIRDRSGRRSLKVALLFRDPQCDRENKHQTGRCRGLLPDQEDPVIFAVRRTGLVIEDQDRARENNRGLTDRVSMAEERPRVSKGRSDSGLLARVLPEGERMVRPDLATVRDPDQGLDPDPATKLWIRRLPNPWKGPTDRVNQRKSWINPIDWNDPYPDA